MQLPVDILVTQSVVFSVKFIAGNINSIQGLLPSAAEPINFATTERALPVVEQGVDGWATST